MKNNKLLAILIIMLVTTLILSSCQPSQPAGLSNDSVIQIVDNLLTAIDKGDYPGFTQDLSAQMKNGFTMDMFTNLADLLRNASGNYVSCADSQPELSNNQGYAVYRLTCNFDLEKVVVTVTFKVNGDKVEGLFFDSPNLRKVSQ